VCSFCLLCTHVHGWRKSVAPALPAVRGVLRRAMNMICRFSYAMQLVRYTLPVPGYARKQVHKKASIMR